jgi:hypothetical protein
VCHRLSSIASTRLPPEAGAASRPPGDLWRHDRIDDRVSGDAGRDRPRWEGVTAIDAGCETVGVDRVPCHGTGGIRQDYGQHEAEFARAHARMPSPTIRAILASARANVHGSIPRRGRT